MNFTSLQAVAPYVSRETYDHLCVYHDLLSKWQNKINLVSPSTLDDIWSRHFLDSLQIIPLLDSHTDMTIADVGCGAGFPGMVISIATHHSVHLIESDQRKMIFLQEVARHTKSQPVFHVKRSESISIAMDIILSRACANIDKLLAITNGLRHNKTRYLIHKGVHHQDEINAALQHWAFDYIVHNSRVQDDSVIIELYNVG
ncbi:MAG: 16S rRNA (guanine(527)-N(7))-methyltransferase RsmG [Rickettsiales bacterium]|nr:16S rRNA (guanine(527)-N(7))-methyltransferase RsmG [Rickettsiales bacterium]